MDLFSWRQCLWRSTKWAASRNENTCKFKKQDYKLVNKEKEILAIWDDHDFGLNDGGKTISMKKSKKCFFKFLECC